MDKKEINKLLNTLYLQTLNVYPVSVRKQLQNKIFEVNDRLNE